MGTFPRSHFPTLMYANPRQLPPRVRSQLAPPQFIRHPSSMEHRRRPGAMAPKLLLRAYTHAPIFKSLICDPQKHETLETLEPAPPKTWARASSSAHRCVAAWLSINISKTDPQNLGNVGNLERPRSRAPRRRPQGANATRWPRPVTLRRNVKGRRTVARPPAKALVLHVQLADCQYAPMVNSGVQAAVSSAARAP